MPALAEPVGGVAEEGSPEDTARREALEEIGLRPQSIDAVDYVWVMPSTTIERVRLFLGAYGQSDRVSAGGGAPDEQEEIAFEGRPLATCGLMPKVGS